MAAVLVSAFYQWGGPESFIRFRFAKQDQVLGDAAVRLAAHFG